MCRKPQAAGVKATMAKGLCILRNEATCQAKLEPAPPGTALPVSQRRDVNSTVPPQHGRSIQRTDASYLDTLHVS